MAEATPELLRARLLELAAYLAAAAHGNVNEPSEYGPYRLLEGAVRVVRLMHELELGDEELRTAADRVVTAAMKVVRDPEIARERADDLLDKAVSRLERAAAPD